MAALSRLPARHSSGNSQRGSAPLSRPTDSATQIEGPNSCLGARAPLTFSSSGADRLARNSRKQAAASSCGVRSATSFAAKAASSCVSSACHAGSASSRASSLARMSSGVGACVHSAVSLAHFSSLSAFLVILSGTISAEIPLRPARPVRPERCSKASVLVGRSACTTSSRLGRSMPRAATSVATHTLARPSRMACRAWLRSSWLSSPDRLTTAKPRLAKRAVRRATVARVLAKTIAVGAS